MSLLLRLAVGSGRGALARQVLVVLGTSLASALLLVATGIATMSQTAFRSGCGRLPLPDGRVVAIACPEVVVTNQYLDQPGLRSGVVIGFVLCVVPLLVFVANASRVAARQRDERLAGLRLAGATQRQVRGLAVLDTVLGGTAGAVLGTVLYLVGRAIVTELSAGQARAVALATTPSFLLGLAVLALLLVALAGGAALTLRAVSITPLGVVRKAPRRQPRPWGALMLTVGLAGIALLAATHQTSGAGQVALAGLLALTMLGLVVSGSWITSRIGRLVARRAQSPALLLAGRHLEDQPRAQARAMSSVLLVVLAATIALVTLGDLLMMDPEALAGGRSSYLSGYLLAGVGMAFSLVVGAAGLLLVTAEGLIERRRTLAALHSGGVPQATLRRAVLAQVALPMVPAATLAVLVGLAFTGVLSRGGFPLTGTVAFCLLLPVLAVGASVLAAAATLPFLGSSTDVEQLRAT